MKCGVQLITKNALLEGTLAKFHVVCTEGLLSAVPANANIESARPICSLTHLKFNTQYSTVYRHKKSGSFYIKISDKVLCGSEPYVLYRSAETGQSWLRPFDEFHDGRFEPLERDIYENILFTDLCEWKNTVSKITPMGVPRGKCRECVSLSILIEKSTKKELVRVELNRLTMNYEAETTFPISDVQKVGIASDSSLLFVKTAVEKFIIKQFFDERQFAASLILQGNDPEDASLDFKGHILTEKRNKILGFYYNPLWKYYYVDVFLSDGTLTDLDGFKTREEACSRIKEILEIPDFTTLQQRK